LGGKRITVLLLEQAVVHRPPNPPVDERHSPNPRGWKSGSADMRCALARLFLNGTASLAAWGEGMSGVEVGIIMGSSSDWETMCHAAETLDQLGVSYETRLVSARRAPT